jgi:hypothetical protein
MPSRKTATKAKDAAPKRAKTSNVTSRAKPALTKTLSAPPPGKTVVKTITRRYLSPMGRSEVGVLRIRKAVRQAAKDAMATPSLKKAAKAI